MELYVGVAGKGDGNTLELQVKTIRWSYRQRSQNPTPELQAKESKSYAGVTDDPWDPTPELQAQIHIWCINDFF